MKRRTLMNVLACGAMCLTVGVAGAWQPASSTKAEPKAKIGEKAPTFVLTDIDGKEHDLAAYTKEEKIVVLEWFNPGCPFVQYAHSDEGPLAGAAAKHAIKGVVWLAINSGAPGKQGHGVETNRQAAAKWSMSYPILIDESGGVGQAYGAKTTPHMYVITPEGEIAYRGALDNAPQGKVPAEGSKNYVEAALADLAAGRPVAIAETQSYGCGVKYP